MSTLDGRGNLSGSAVDWYLQDSDLRSEDCHGNKQLRAAIEALWYVIIGHCLTAGQNHDRLGSAAPHASRVGSRSVKLINNL